MKSTKNRMVLLVGKTVEPIVSLYVSLRMEDDLGRVVIPKEIRRTMRIREGDPSSMTLTWLKAMMETVKRCGMDKK